MLRDLVVAHSSLESKAGKTRLDVYIATLRILRSINGISHSGILLSKSYYYPFDNQGYLQFPVEEELRFCQNELRRCNIVAIPDTLNVVASKD